MRPDSRRWQLAEKEHAEAVAALLVAASLVPDHKWAVPLPPSAWSPAQTVLHVEQSYAIAVESLSGGSGMAVRSPALVSFINRTVVLPLMLATKSFPKRAPAPRELRPEPGIAHGLPREALTARVQASAAAAVAALRAAVAEGRAPAVTHAYFGRLSPYQALRLLSAHTRHHAKLLAPPKITGKSKPCVPELEQIGA